MAAIAWRYPGVRPHAWGIARLYAALAQAMLRSHSVPAPMPRFRSLPVDVVIDVRSRLEFWLGHLPGAICLPVGGIAQSVVDRGIAKDARLLVYCASGARSAQATAILRQLGYKRVTDGGGMANARAEFQAD